MKRLIIILAFLAVGSAFATGTGSNCAKAADSDFEVLDQPMIALSNGFTTPADNDILVDSLLCWGNGNGKQFEIYLYSRVFDYPSYDCVQKYGPFSYTIDGTGEQECYVMIATEVDTSVAAYVVLWNCIDEPQLQTDVDDVPGNVTYVETADADCSAASGYYNITANLAERIHFCLYYTLTPIPEEGGPSRRRKLLISEEDDAPIQMVYCSACGTHTALN